MIKKSRQVNLFGVNISITNKQKALAMIQHWVLESQKSKTGKSSSFILHPSSLRTMVVVTPNPEMIVAARNDPQFLRDLNSADLAIPDGWGLVAAERLLKSKVKSQKSKVSRLSGLDLMESLVALAVKKNWKVMFLGGKPGVAQKAAQQLQKKLPITNYQLPITSLSGPPNISLATKKEDDDLIKTINRARPDLLFVAFGHAKQERWMAAHRRQLDAGVMLGIGGALDQIADPTLRPPAFLHRVGLGWMYRLFRQPWRIKRQISLVEFIGMTVRGSISQSAR